MTHELSDLLQRGADRLDPLSGQRILDQAIARGASRRRRRRLAAGSSAFAITAVTCTGVVLTTGGGPGTAPSVVEDPAPATAPPAAPSASAEPSYAPGSDTQVPEGPVVVTDRKVVEDAALAAVTRDLLAAEGEVGDVTVEHVATSSPSHMADRTREGRRVSLTYDGAMASVTIERWDGYAAVGIEGMGPGVDPREAEQRAATTAREACGGSYKVFPAIRCQEAAEGWYSVMRPYQGDTMPATHQQLLVSLFTDDGYVVRVDSYNTAAEKAGAVVADDPVLTLAESLALARSPRWFRAAG